MSYALTDKMTKEDLQWLEVIISLPDGSRLFQSELISASQGHVTDIYAIAKCISLAHAAISISMSGQDDLFSSWYLDMGQRLMRRSMDALSLLASDDTLDRTALPH